MTAPPDTRGWPAGLVEIAGIIGAEKALALVDAFGGVAIYIPKTMKPTHAIAAVIGLEAGLKLCAWRPVDHVVIPTLYAARSKKLLIAKARGTNRSIARAMGVTDRYVRLIRQGGEDQGEEPGLF